MLDTARAATTGGYVFSLRSAAPGQDQLTRTATYDRTRGLTQVALTLSDGKGDADGGPVEFTYLSTPQGLLVDTRSSTGAEEELTKRHTRLPAEQAADVRDLFPAQPPGLDLLTLATAPGTVVGARTATTTYEVSVPEYDALSLFGAGTAAGLGKDAGLSDADLRARLAGRVRATVVAGADDGLRSLRLDLTEALAHVAQLTPDDPPDADSPALVEITYDLGGPSDLVPPAAEDVAAAG